MTTRRNLLLAFSLFLPGFAFRAQSAAAQKAVPAAIAIPVAVPGGEAGIGFDDLRYSAPLKRFLVPAGQTGKLALLDPATRQITTLGPFGAAAGAKYGGGHGEGVTSADSGAGFLFSA